MSHGTARRRRLKAIATVVTLALLTACSSSAKPAAAPHPTSTAPIATTPTIAGFRNAGAGVLVAESLPAAVTAETTKAVTAPFPAFTSASEIFQLSTPTEPAAPADIILPLRAPATAEAVPVVFVSSTGTGGWEPLATTVTADGTSVRATTPHFSFFTTLLVPVKELIGAAKDLFDTATSGVTAEAKAPQCDQEAAARQAGWAVASKGPDTLRWCFGLDAHGTHQVMLVNNRRYPLDVSHAGATLVHSGPRDLTDAAHYVPVPTGLVLLFPRDEAVYTTTGPARFRTEVDGLAQSVYALQIGSETAVGLMNKFGLAKGLKAAAVADKLLSFSKCGLTLGHADGGDVLKNCFGDPALLLAAFGAKGLFLAAVMTASGLIQFFHSELNALGDQFNGRDGYSILVTHTAAAEPVGPSCTATEFGKLLDVTHIAGYHCVGRVAIAVGATPTPGLYGGRGQAVSLVFKAAGTRWVVVGGPGGGVFFSAQDLMGVSPSEVVAAGATLKDGAFNLSVPFCGARKGNCP